MSRVRIASPALEDKKNQENRKVDQESFRYPPNEGWLKIPKLVVRLNPELASQNCRSGEISEQAVESLALAELTSLIKWIC
ncbi:MULTISPECIES: hypothetical protein [unclassified Microcoleus]|uniref:hypothetical protein n=1 Tax=unclassified Microcoleus TaxID=2642155 RepID=UPI002FCF35C7